MGKKKLQKGILIIFAVCIFLEAIVFNINSFKLLGKNYEKFELYPEQAILKGLEYNKEKDVYNALENDIVIEFKGINKEIGTLKLNIGDINVKRTLVMRVYYTDETQEYYYLTSHTNEIEISNTIERTKYIPVNTIGKVQDLKIEIYDTDEMEIRN